MLLVVTGSAVSAQSLTVAGHVARSTVDGERPVPRSWVTLHRIGQQGGVAIDSLLTSARGEYRFKVERPDSTAMYLATARFGGIAYFAPPVRAGEPAPEGEIHVFDTTSVRIPLHVEGRHLVVAAPAPDGWRVITDVWELANDTVLTRLSRPGDPAFSVAVPTGARNVRSTQGDYSGSAVDIREGSASIVAPVAPGLRQLVLTYELPPSAFPWRVPLSDSSSVMEVLLEESTGVVQGGTLEALGAVPSEGRTFLRFLGRDVPRGATIEVRLQPPADDRPRWPWLAGLGLAALGALAWSLRARPASGPKPLSRILELQAALAGVDGLLGSNETAAGSHEALRDYRDTLQHELDALLAPRSDDG